MLALYFAGLGRNQAARLCSQYPKQLPALAAVVGSLGSWVPGDPPVQPAAHTCSSSFGSVHHLVYFKHPLLCCFKPAGFVLYCLRLTLKQNCKKRKKL